MASQFEVVPEDSGSSDSYSHISCEEPEEDQTETTNPTSQNKKKWGFSRSLKVNKRIEKTVLSVNEFGQPNSKEAAEFANCKEWECSHFPRALRQNLWNLVQAQLHELSKSEAEDASSLGDSLSPHDLYSQVRGEERRGCVKMYGLGLAPSDVWGHLLQKWSL